VQKKIKPSVTARKQAVQDLGAFLTEDEVAERLGTTKRHVRILRMSDRLGYVMVGGKVRVTEADLHAFIAARRVRARQA
jgi:excisionase family DNA binding protein